MDQILRIYNIQNVMETLDLPSGGTEINIDVATRDLLPMFSKKISQTVITNYVSTYSVLLLMAEN